MKKILSFLLGLTLLMSLTVPALAATSDTIDKESLRVGYGVWPDDIQKTTSVGNEKKLFFSIARTVAPSWTVGRSSTP